MKRTSWLAPAIIVIILVAAAAFALGRHERNSQATITPQPSSSPHQSSATSASTPQAQVARCTAASLGLSQGTVQGTAGTQYVTVVMTNHSAIACTLNGFPGVSLADSAGAQVGQPATRSTTQTSQPITLIPNTVAHFDLGFPDAGNFAAGTCSALAPLLKVYAPDDTATLSLDAINRPWCPGFSTTAISLGSGT